MAVKNDPLDIPDLKNETSAPTEADNASMREAQRVDELAQWTPSAVQTSRKVHPANVSDSPNAVPKHSVQDEDGHHDSTHRQDEKLV